MSDLAQQLDAIAAEGRITSITLVRTGDRWQAYGKLARTNGYAAQSGATPSESLAAMADMLPICEEYDIKNGLVGGNREDKKPAAKVTQPAPIEVNTEDVGDLLG